MLRRISCSASHFVLVSCLCPVPPSQREFAQKFLPNDPMFQVVSNLYEVVPAVLGKTGKVCGCEGGEQGRGWRLCLRCRARSAR